MEWLGIMALQEEKSNLKESEGCVA